MCQTQQEVKNFTNFNFNSLNGPGQRPGMLSDVMQVCRTQEEVKNFNNLIFNLSNGLGYKLGMLSDVMH